MLADPDIGGAAGLLHGNDEQLWAQILSVLVTGLYSGVATFILLHIVKAVMGLRVDPHVEYWGLDLAHHGETIVEYLEGLPKKIPANPYKEGKKKLSRPKAKKKK